MTLITGSNYRNDRKQSVNKILSTGPYNRTYMLKPSKKYMCTTEIDLVQEKTTLIND